MAKLKNLKLIKLKDFLRTITSSKMIQKTLFFIFRLRAVKAKSSIARKCFQDYLESKNLDIINLIISNNIITYN